MENEVVLLILFWSGVGLSLLFRLPPVKAWWEKQTGAFKIYFTLVLNGFAGTGILIVACIGIEGIIVPVTCDAVGVGKVIVALGTIVGGNQLAYLLPEGLKKK